MVLCQAHSLDARSCIFKWWNMFLLSLGLGWVFYSTRCQCFIILFCWPPNNNKTRRGFICLYFCKAVHHLDSVCTWDLAFCLKGYFHFDIPLTCSALSLSITHDWLLSCCEMYFIISHVLPCSLWPLSRGCLRLWLHSWWLVSSKSWRGVSTFQSLHCPNTLPLLPMASLLANNPFHGCTCWIVAIV